MRLLERVKLINALNIIPEKECKVKYEYDAQDRVVKEIVTGDIERVSSFQYNANDDVEKEIYEDNEKVITKIYSYKANGNIDETNITVVKK